jgi:hypothetical protein
MPVAGTISPTPKNHTDSRNGSILPFTLRPPPAAQSAKDRQARTFDGAEVPRIGAAETPKYREAAGNQAKSANAAPCGTPYERRPFSLLNTRSSRRVK